MDAETIAEIFIRRFYRQHSLPAVIICDRNRQFVNILWKMICQIFGIQRKLPQFTTHKLMGWRNEWIKQRKRFYVFILILINAIKLKFRL